MIRFPPLDIDRMMIRVLTRSDEPLHVFLYRPRWWGTFEDKATQRWQHLCGTVSCEFLQRPCNEWPQFTIDVEMFQGRKGVKKIQKQRGVDVIPLPCLRRRVLGDGELFHMRKER